MMVAVDTNILVRYLTWDDEKQAQDAAGLLEGGGPIWVSTIVLCETVWVLKQGRQYPRQAIAKALRTVLAPDHIMIEDEEALEAGLDALGRGVDFADGCILSLAKRSKAQVLFTFDKRLAKAGSPMVRLLGSA